MEIEMVSDSLLCGRGCLGSSSACGHVTIQSWSCDLWGCGTPEQAAPVAGMLLT